MRNFLLITALFCALSAGCRSTSTVAHRSPAASGEASPAVEQAENAAAPSVRPASFTQDETSDAKPPSAAAPSAAAPSAAAPSAAAPSAAAPADSVSIEIPAEAAEPPDASADDPDPAPTFADTAASQDASLNLSTVVDSVHRSFPLVTAALQQRNLAEGNRIAAWGAFDTKLKASSESQPLGFYETYRNKIGIENPIYEGGQWFAGYRNGGGVFEPWYKERETNDGGEFKAGVRVPLIRDRDIDARRANLWRATYEQQMADPFVRQALIEFTRDAGLAYWKWVAASQKYEVGKQWLELARSRNGRIETSVKRGNLGPPELIDNQRAIAKREAKLADSLRVLQQSAAKLSLYLRDDNGQPIVPASDLVVDFPALRVIDQSTVNMVVAQAQQARPELVDIDLQLQRLRVDYAEASNMTRPGLDAQLIGGQDVGEPTSKKRDKSEFELEAGLYFDVPLQRRKGLGKMQAVRAKMAQVTAKRRMVQDKIQAEVQAAVAGLIQSRQEALKAREAVRLAGRMAEIEREKFDAGISDLLKVALREQYTIEAAEEAIKAAYNHYVAFTLYAAALAVDRPEPSLLPAAE